MSAEYAPSGDIDSLKNQVRYWRRQHGALLDERAALLGELAATIAREANAPVPVRQLAAALKDLMGWLEAFDSMERRRDPEDEETAERVEMDWWRAVLALREAFPTDAAAQQAYLHNRGRVRHPAATFAAAPDWRDRPGYEHCRRRDHGPIGGAS